MGQLWVKYVILGLCIFCAVRICKQCTMQGMNNMKESVDYQENRSNVLCRNLRNFAYREHCYFEHVQFVWIINLCWKNIYKNLIRSTKISRKLIPTPELFWEVKPVDLRTNMTSTLHVYFIALCMITQQQGITLWHDSMRILKVDAIEKLLLNRLNNSFGWSKHVANSVQHSPYWEADGSSVGQEISRIL